MTKILTITSAAVLAMSLPLAAAAHDANFEHGHVYPNQQPAQQPAASTYSNQPALQPNVSSSRTISPVYGGTSSRQNHRYLTTYKVKTSVYEALNELKTEEKALKRRDYEKNTRWIDGHRDAYNDDIDELNDIQKQLNALLQDQTDDALVGHPDGKPSEWRVGPYDKPYVKGDKWISLDDLKEYFRPKSTRANYPVKQKAPKVQGAKKKKGGLLRKINPKNW